MGLETAIIIGALATAGGAAVGAISARKQAKSQSAIAKYNAQVLEQQAKAQEQAGKVVVAERLKRNRRLVASQRAAFAASGVQPTGTPLIVELAEVKRGTLDALMEGHNIGIGVQQTRSAAELQRATGRAAIQTGRLAVGQQLFSGAVGLAGGAAKLEEVKRTG